MNKTIQLVCVATFVAAVLAISAQGSGNQPGQKPAIIATGTVEVVLPHGSIVGFAAIDVQPIRGDVVLLTARKKNLANGPASLGNCNVWYHTPEGKVIVNVDWVGSGKLGRKDHHMLVDWTHIGKR